MLNIMNLRKIVLYLALISFFLPYNKVFANTFIVSIDASRSIGQLHPLLSASIWFARIDKNEYMVKKFFRENEPSTIQFTIRVLRESKSLEDYNRMLRKKYSTDTARFVFKKIKEYNALPVIGFETGTMPSWLSSRKGDKRKAMRDDWWTVEMLSPPSSYDLWAKVVEDTLNFFIEEFKLEKIGLWVGHEPNFFWLGTDESFFRFYEYAAKAAKKINKNILVGGIGVAGAQAERVDCNWDSYTESTKKFCYREGGWRTNADPMIKNFIEYISRKKIPLDFINWHSFGAIPEHFSEVAGEMNMWIKNAGIKNKVFLYLSDWTYWRNPYPADYLDTEETAAYIVNALWHIYKAGIDWHGYDFDISDPSREKDTSMKRKGAEFIGDWPLFTRHEVVKPSYNVFKALSYITKDNTKLLQMNFPEYESIVGFSTISEDRQKVSILLSNYIPQGKRFNEFLFNKLKTFLIKEGMKQEVDLLKRRIGERKKGKSPSTQGSPEQKELFEYVSNVSKCLDRDDVVGCEQKASMNLRDPENIKIREMVSTLLKSKNESRTVKINITNLLFSENASLTTYTIDSHHANACGYNKRTEPRESGTVCGIEGVVDKAVRNAEKKASEQARDAAMNELKAQGLRHEEIEALKRDLKRCEAEDSNVLKCIKKIASRTGIEKEIEQAYAVFQEVKRDAHSDGMEAINTQNEISLEGSKKVENITLNKEKQTFTVSIEPNAIKLLVLQK